MFADRKSATVVTASDGTATGYIEVPRGRVMSMHYVKTDFADGSTFTITAEATGETIWTETGVNASAHRYPRVALNNTDGTAALFAAAGKPLVDPIFLAADRIVISISGAGATKTGTFIAVLG